MKLLLDNSNLFAGGGLQVAFSFLHDLKKLALPNDYHVVQSIKCAENFDASGFPKNFTFYTLSKNEEHSKRLRISKVRSLENAIRPDCIFTLFGPSYHKSNFPKIVGFAIPFIIYPNSPFFNQISLKEKIYYKLLTILKTYCFKKYSDTLVFETEDARKIFNQKYNYSKDSFVVGNALNEIFTSLETLPELKIQGLSSLNILLLAANYPHKNIHIVPKVIQVLKEKHQICDFKFLLTLEKKELNFPAYCDENIIFLGKVALNQIPSLYIQTDFVFIPTLLEVFSATYLEAMFMEKPIIASDLGFSRDVCGQAALFCDATNAEAYANSIVRLQNDEKLKNKLIANGVLNLERFGNSMDRTHGYLNIIKKIILTNENTK